MEGIDFNKDIETLSTEDVDSEINFIKGGDRNSPYFNTNHLDHGRYLGRMEALYRKKFPEGDRQQIPEPDRSLHDVIRAEGFQTEEEIKAESQDTWDRIEASRMLQAKVDGEAQLRSEFGGETEQVINYAHYAVDRFLKNALSAEDWNELNGAMGNDPVFIKKLSDVIRYLDEKHWHGKNRSYKREKEIE